MFLSALDIRSMDYPSFFNDLIVLSFVLLFGHSNSLKRNHLKTNSRYLNFNLCVYLKVVKRLPVVQFHRRHRLMEIVGRCFRWLGAELMELLECLNVFVVEFFACFLASFIFFVFLI